MLHILLYFFESDDGSEIEVEKSINFDPLQTNEVVDST